MANSVLAKMAVQISANTAEFSKAMTKTQSQLKGFSNNINQLATGLLATFGTQQVIAFGLEISKLAGEADGVKKAFNKLPNSVKLMEELKTVTGGTVSELELMKRTVQAANFGISLSALPKLLEFASVRAQQTGQSVDYLVDSIVTGIGRKSPLILDNLGISAVALKEKLGDVSIAAADVGTVAEAVGKIATEELEKMGSMAETTATKIARLDANWENFKVTLGTTANNSGVLNFLLELATKALAGNSALVTFEVGLRDFNRSLASGNFTGSYALQLEELQKNAELAGKKIILLTDPITGLKKAVVDVRTPIVALTTDFKKITEQTKPLFDGITATGRALAILVSGVGDTKKSPVANLGLQFDDLAEKAKNMNFQILTSSSTARDAFGDMVDGMSESMEDLRPLLLEFGTDLFAGFGEAIAGVTSFGDAFLKSISDFMKALGRQMIALGVAKLLMESINKFGFGGVGGAALIAGGVALSAAAAAIGKATISGGAGGSSVRGNNSNYSNFSNSQTVIFDGQFKIDGRDLVYVVNKNANLDNKRKG